MLSCWSSDILNCILTFFRQITLLTRCIAVFVETLRRDLSQQTPSFELSCGKTDRCLSDVKRDEANSNRQTIGHLLH